MSSFLSLIFLSDAEPPLLHRLMMITINAAAAHDEIFQIKKINHHAEEIRCRHPRMTWYTKGQKVNGDPHIYY